MWAPPVLFVSQSLTLVSLHWRKTPLNRCLEDANILKMYISSAVCFFFLFYSVLDIHVWTGHVVSIWDMQADRGILCSSRGNINFTVLTLHQHKSVRTNYVVHCITSFLQGWINTVPYEFNASIQRMYIMRSKAFGTVFLVFINSDAFAGVSAWIVYVVST